MPSITGIRLSPHGIAATLVNISETGLLVECAEGLKPGTALTVSFDGAFGMLSVPGTVARTSVSMTGRHHLRYHVGIHFAHPIALPDATASARPVEQSCDQDIRPARPIARNRW